MPENWFKCIPDKLVNTTILTRGLFMRRKLLLWSKTPIHVPRWLLTAKYLGFVVLGVLSALSGGIQTINVVSFQGYTLFWSYAVIAAGLVAMIGSFSERWELSVEKWAALVVFALLITWGVAAVIRSISDGDLTRAPGAFAILLISMLPGVRALSLLRKTA